MTLSSREYSWVPLVQELEEELKNPRELAYVNTRIQEVLHVLAAFKERRADGGEIPHTCTPHRALALLHVRTAVAPSSLSHRTDTHTGRYDCAHTCA